MKKSMAYAISKGIALIILAQASSAVIADGVEYKVGWDSTAERYRVYLRPDATPTPDLTLSAQVTLRVPSGVGADQFTVDAASVENAHNGVTWSATSTVRAPEEDNTVDYISFTPNISNNQAFGLQANQEQEIFSFQNSGNCLGPVVIMDNKNDPFNQPEGATDNSVGTNPGNEFSSVVWSSTDNDFLGIYGGNADCKGGGGATTNNSPIANNDTASVEQDSSVNVAVLNNDTDADNDNLTITGKTNGANGTVVLVGDQSVTYTPDNGFVGVDNFTYTITDGEGGENTGTVNITVTAKTTGGSNNSPVAKDDAAFLISLSKGAVKLLNVSDLLSNFTDADGDTLTVTAVGTATYGSVRLQNNIIRYEAGSDYVGSDSFTYTVGDGRGGQATGRVNVNVIDTTVPVTGDNTEEVSTAIPTLTEWAQILLSLLLGLIAAGTYLRRDNKL